MTQRAAGVARKVLLMLGSIALTLVAAEAAFRIASGQPVFACARNEDRSGQCILLVEDRRHCVSNRLRAFALLREARRQKGLATVDVPAVCILRPLATARHDRHVDRQHAADL